jgi:hypothetical protein
MKKKRREFKKRRRVILKRDRSRRKLNKKRKRRKIGRMGVIERGDPRIRSIRSGDSNRKAGEDLEGKVRERGGKVEKSQNMRTRSMIETQR